MFARDGNSNQHSCIVGESVLVLRSDLASQALVVLHRFVPRGNSALLAPQIFGGQVLHMRSDGLRMVMSGYHASRFSRRNT